MPDSYLPAIVSPVQQRLPLPRTAKRIAGLAVHFDLIDVTTKGLPALDLPSVLLRHPPAHVIAAVPLKPAPRIFGMDPAFPAPDRERLAGINAEIVQRAVDLIARA